MTSTRSARYAHHRSSTRPWCRTSRCSIDPDGAAGIDASNDLLDHRRRVSAGFQRMILQRLAARLFTVASAPVDVGVRRAVRPAITTTTPLMLPSYILGRSFTTAAASRRPGSTATRKAPSRRDRSESLHLRTWRDVDGIAGSGARPRRRRHAWAGRAVKNKPSVESPGREEALHHTTVMLMTRPVRPHHRVGTKLHRDRGQRARRSW